MRAITVKQPWARCIAAGLKLVENRGRATSYRGLLAIHAGRSPDPSGNTDPRVVELFGESPSISQPHGAAVAVAQLVDCHLSSKGFRVCCTPWGERWHNDRAAWHLVLEGVVHLDQPVYVRGQQAVPWTLPEDVAAAVAAQLTEVSRA